MRIEREITLSDIKEIGNNISISNIYKFVYLLQ